MSDSRAFTQVIDPIGSGPEEDNSVHQVSPDWVLTFVRWENRDTQRIKSVSPTQVRDPLVVQNDCLSVSVTTSKGTLTPSMSATLVMTDVNYQTSVAPGDFVFVNILNSPDESLRVAENAKASRPINGPDDGFKGVYKVQSVRRLLVSEPGSGTKTVLFNITGFAFTEFNNTIYFNPYLIDPSQDQSNQLLFASFIGKDWKNLVNKKGLDNVQDIIAVLIQSLIGTGLVEGQLSAGFKQSAVQTENVHFFMPSLVGKLLGINGVKAAKDIYIYLFGLQEYAAGAAASLASGMNPIIAQEKYPRFFYTPVPCDGRSILKPEYWNQVKTWSILNQYTNAPLNELYTCFRISPTNKIMPTLVFRQIPFTTEDFEGDGDVTNFLNLPRWKINPALILQQDIGRDESARINFMQYFGRSTLGKEGTAIAFQIAQKNYVYDIDDVQRSGLRPYIVTTQFDEVSTTDKTYRSPIWAKIVGDAVIGGHLKLNGTIVTAGLVDPIAVGDNMEFDGIVYHIEQITHTAIYNPERGLRTFRTNISLSSGVSTSSSSQGTRYAEMTYTSASTLRKRDFNNNQILPGISESQDIISRSPDVDSSTTTNSPFPQPGTGGIQDNNGSDT